MMVDLGRTGPNCPNCGHDASMQHSLHGCLVDDCRCKVFGDNLSMSPCNCARCKEAVHVSRQLDEMQTRAEVAEAALIRATSEIASELHFLANKLVNRETAWHMHNAAEIARTYPWKG